MNRAYLERLSRDQLSKFILAFQICIEQLANRVAEPEGRLAQLPSQLIGAPSAGD